MSLDWIDDELKEFEARGLYRSLRRVNSRQGPVIELDGQEVINFSSNDYLGLAADPRLGRAAHSAALRWGAGAGSSRLIAGNLALFTELEAELAGFVGTESCLVFTSGYHGNLGLIPALAGKNDVIFSDRLNHASVIDGCRLSRARVAIYEHRDLDHLERLLKEHGQARRKLVVSEGLFSMDGDLAPLPGLIETAKRAGAMIVIDDAHALGVLGPHGRGSLDHFGIPATEVDALLGTLGKALGSSGAFVCGQERLVKHLVNRGRTFVFTTGPSPLAAAAALESLRICMEEPWRRDRALAHAGRIRDGLCGMGRPTDDCPGAIVPVILGEPGTAMTACRRLIERGLFVQGIRPPTVPEGTARLRISASAGHTPEQVDRLLEGLKEVVG